MLSDSSEAYASTPKVKGCRYHPRVRVSAQEAVIGNEESATVLALESWNLLILVRSIAAFDYSLGATEAALRRLNDLTVELEKVLCVLLCLNSFIHLKIRLRHRRIRADLPVDYIQPVPEGDDTYAPSYKSPSC